MIGFPRWTPRWRNTGFRGSGQLRSVASPPANPICSLQTQKLKSFTSRGRNKRQGAAAVEFAFVAPIFVILTLGMIEFGRLIMVEQMITNAAREGCRAVSIAAGTAWDATSDVTT